MAVNQYTQDYLNDQKQHPKLYKNTHLERHIVNFAPTQTTIQKGNIRKIYGDQ